MIFSEIENAVLNGKVDAGVIIHENRFTYADKGLQKIADLGDYWEKKTGHPIPLGGIVIKRTMQPLIKKQVDLLIRQSIAFAFAAYPELNDYIRVHSQEMSESVMRKHIELYVNDHSIDLGATGKAAVIKLLEVFAETKGINKISGDNIFV